MSLVFVENIKMSTVIQIIHIFLKSHYLKLILKCHWNYTEETYSVNVYKNLSNLSYRIILIFFKFKFRLFVHPVFVHMIYFHSNLNTSKI
jgi:hypothetical protein